MLPLHKQILKTLKDCAGFLHEWSSCHQGHEEGQIPVQPWLPPYKSQLLLLLSSAAGIVDIWLLGLVT